MDKNKYSLVYYVIIFVVVQILLLAIVGLWIMRYVANNMVMNKIGEQYSIKVPYQGSVPILIIGLVLLLLVIIGMSLLFRYLSIQFRKTKMYDNFIANVTHELKTPLASIRLYVDTITKRNLSKDNLESFINRIRKETKRLDGLVDKILDVAKIDQKEMKYNCKTYSSYSFFQNIFDKLHHEYKDTSIDYRMDLGQTKCLVDKDSIYRMFKNLVDNSKKYTRRETEIDIKLYIEDNDIKIIYQDNGIGLPSEEEKKIFRKFYRADNTNGGNVKGSGLGLYFVKKVIDYHGGDIEADSSQNMKNQGLTFYITLPTKDSLNSYRKRKLMG